MADLQSITSDEGKGWQAIHYLMDAAFIAPQAAETVNRAVTALASYRLNLKKLMNDPARAPGPLTDAEFSSLADTVADDVRNTQGNYARDNKAPWAQKEMLRPMLTFKTYAMNVWYLVTHNMVQSIQAETKEQLRRDLAQALRHVLIVDLHDVEQYCWTREVKVFNTGYTKAGHPLKYGSTEKGYGLGWAISMKQMKALCPHRVRRHKQVRLLQAGNLGQARGLHVGASETDCRQRGPLRGLKHCPLIDKNRQHIGGAGGAQIGHDLG